MTTYTPIARLPIMTPGDPAVKNSWGTTLNAAIPLIEQTAAGSVSISLTGIASLTLTTASDAPDQARMAMLNFTGTPSGPATITIPSVARIGWVANNSSNTVTLTTGAGTTLTLSTGLAFLYTCDGTNITAVNAVPPGSFTAQGAITLLNNQPLRSFDTGGTARSMLSMDVSNNVNLTNGGGASFRLQSQAGATLLTVTNAGAVSLTSTLGVAGLLTASAGLSVTGAATASGTITGGAFTTAGNVNAAAITASGLLTAAGLTVTGNAAVGGSMSVTGAVGMSSSLNVNTTIGVTGAANFGSTLAASGQITGLSVNARTGLLLDNASAIQSKDPGGTYRLVMYVSSDNFTNHFNATGNVWRVLNQAGSGELFRLDNAGNCTVTGGLSAPTLTATSAIATNFYMPNAGFLLGKDTGGTYRGMMTLDTANCVSILNAGGNQVRILNQSGSGAFWTCDAAGNTTTLGNETISGTIYANGSTAVGGAGGYLVFGGASTGAWGPVGMSVIAANGVTSGAGFYVSSDGRMKTDIADITHADGIDWITRGRPRTYTMNGRPSAGFVAQEDVAAGRGAAVMSMADDRPEFAASDGTAPAGQRLIRRYEHDIAYLTAALQGALARITALEQARGA